MSADDTSKAMKFQAKQYIPLPISSVTIDWVKVGEKNLKMGQLSSRFCFVSVPNEHIQKYKNIFRNAGLNLVAIELEGFASARVLTSDNEKTTFDY